MPGGAKAPEPTIINLTWDTPNLTISVGGTASTTVSNDIANYMQYLTSSDIDALTSSVATSSVDGTTHTVTFTGVAAGTVTIPANTIIQSPQSVVSTNALTITVVDATPKYLDKDGLDYYDSLIATEIDGKQDTLTAGSGISISNNVISATGGGVADSVAWGHITGTMSDQTDLTTTLAAKANSADLATVATSGDYDDLTDKPTIGNATLTIQKNGTSAGTFTANATSNKTINITVPTTAADVSALPASTKYGASIAVSINTTNYKVTTTLKDQDGNTLGAAQVIDLPLESVVVNGSYDNTNKKIILTLQNGNTIDIPVADLVAGLQSEITSTNKLASDLVDDTGQTNKFMTSAEKTKLSGIAAGAEVNVQANWTQTTTTADDYIKNKPSLATVATSGSYNDLSNKPTVPNIKRRTGGSTTSDVSLLYVAGDGTTTTPMALKTHGDAHTGSFSYVNINEPASNITEAYVGGYVWDEYEDWWSKKNEVRLALYSDIPTVPTKTSDLTNDSGFLTSVTWGDVTGKPTFATVATSGSYNDLSNRPTIPAAQVNSDWNASSGVAEILNKPTNVSAFTNDAGYITSYTDNKVTQTSTSPTSVTTYYPVASVSNSTNTADVKKFSGFNLKYYNNDGGDAELVLGQDSYYSPIEGKLTLWNSAASQKTTTIRSAEGTTINQLLYSPYTVDALGGRLIANSAYDTATGSATHPVYADAHGILQQTTYTLEKSVPSDAVFTDTTYSDATTSASGLMSASDKTKLNGIASGAEVNVQSDWNQTTTTADDYIKNKPSLATVATSGSYNDLSNKPTIPTVNNATLTIQRNGTNVQTFTANSSSNKTANITVPTKTSDLTNDGADNTSTYVEADELATVATTGSYADLTNKPTIPAAQVQSDWTQATTTAVDYIKNKPNLATVATSGSYNDLSNKPTIPTVNNATLTIQKNGTTVKTFTANASSNVTANITVPTKTSDLTNDSGFLDSIAWGDVTGKPTFATVATSGSYNDLSNKPTIPAAQVQSNWTQTTTTAVDYIKNKPTLATVATSGSYNDLSNKPTIPTVNNATLTIQKNGTTVKTFTANASSNVTANITVPTATSDLTNDGADGTDTYVETADIANFITAEDIASTSALTPPVQTNMIADGAVTTAKIDWSTVTSANLASAAPQDITSLITPVQNSWTSRNDIKMYRYGNVIVLRFYQWWVASISANSACNMGTINTSVLGAMAPFCGSMEVINGDDGKILNHGFIYINSEGGVRAYCPSARNGATSMRGSLVWIYV